MYTYRRKIRADRKTALIGSSGLDVALQIAVHFVIHIDDTGEPVKLSQVDKPGVEPVSIGIIQPGDCICFSFGSFAPNEEIQGTSLVQIFATSTTQADTFATCTILAR